MSSKQKSLIECILDALPQAEREAELQRQKGAPADLFILLLTPELPKLPTAADLAPGRTLN